MLIVFHQLLVVCSLEEAGRYLETYKSFESKPPDLIMEKSEGTYMSQVDVAYCTLSVPFIHRIGNLRDKTFIEMLPSAVEMIQCNCITQHYIKN